MSDMISENNDYSDKNVVDNYNGQSIVNNNNKHLVDLEKGEFSLVNQIETFPEPELTIKVLGIGGAGCNIVNSLLEEGLEDVMCIVANTDVKSLKSSKAHHKILIGRKVTKGVSAGGIPIRGKEAAEEQIEELGSRFIKDTSVLFLISGMGGGTGTGATPVIAQKASELGVLTIGMVLTPFKRDGKKRMKLAEKGIEELCQYTDLLIVIANEKLISQELDDKTTQLESYQKINDFIYQCISGVKNLLTKQGVVDIDLAHLESLIKNKHAIGLIGMGQGQGETRSIDATRKAIYNPLLEPVTGADEVLVNVFSGSDIKELEIGQIEEVIRSSFNTELDNIIFGSTIGELPDDQIQVLVVATKAESPLMRSYPAQKGKISPVADTFMDTAVHLQKAEVTHTPQDQKQTSDSHETYDVKDINQSDLEKVINPQKVSKAGGQKWKGFGSLLFMIKGRKNPPQEHDDDSNLPKLLKNVKN